jgi:GTP-binding protein YchF
MEKRVDRTRKQMKGGDKKFQTDLELFEKILEVLGKGQLVRSMDLTPDEREIVDQIYLLTSKPLLYCANISENDLDTIETNPMIAKVRDLAASEKAEVMVICAKIEEEIAQLEDSEKTEYLQALGLKESGLDQLIRSSYKLLGLISYLTAGEQEVRAWTIEKGMKAPQAAGKIHSDFERGFIRAEIVAYDDLTRLGSHSAAREQGLVRSEGKEYIMHDGDVTLFRFNV